MAVPVSNIRGFWMFAVVAHFLIGRVASADDFGILEAKVAVGLCFVLLRSVVKIHPLVALCFVAVDGLTRGTESGKSAAVDSGHIPNIADLEYDAVVETVNVVRYMIPLVLELSVVDGVFGRLS